MKRFSGRKLNDIVLSALCCALACSSALAEPAVADGQSGPCAGPTFITPALGEIGSVPPRKGHRAPDSVAAAAAVTRLLNTLEPGGPAGAVQVGYTLAIPVLSLFQNNGGEWSFDERVMDYYLDVIRKVDRPIVVVLLANHFSGRSPLAEYLTSKPANLALLANGKPPEANYYGAHITPFTLSANPGLEVNRYRFSGMRKALEALAKLDQEVPGRVLAVTLGGETHQMFENLQGNTGTFANIQYSDFNPRSLQDFRLWLRDKFHDLKKFNAAAGTHFTKWSEIMPPGKDIRKDKLEGFYEHFDAYAPGKMPVYGWVNPKEAVQRIEIKVDGGHVGDAEYGLNRQDVYEARKDLPSANVGYRFDLDYRKLSPGQHVLQVVLVRASGKVLQSEVIFSVMDASQAPPKSSWWRTLRARWVRMRTTVGGVDGWADAPKNMQDVYFNPFAALWQDFRQAQVASLLNAYAGVAKTSGFDMSRVYSHQIEPWWNGAWNDVLFATGDTPQSVTSLKPGVSLYGGLTTSEGLLRKAGIGAGYGVPEFNPQVLNSQAETDRALAFHVKHCARFVSPYFFLLVPPADNPTDKHSLFWISNAAPAPNGRFLYQSIIDMAKR